MSTRPAAFEVTASPSGAVGPGGTAVESDGVPRPGSELAGPRGRYRLASELGHGGFGVTWLAQASWTTSEATPEPAEVVVKLLRVDRMDDWKAWELFEREARVLAALAHPNIPRFLDFFEVRSGGADGRLAGLALVQTRVEGRVLRGARLDGGELRRCFRTLLEVCAYLHGLNPPVLHRDINPKNIILRGDGEPVLIDFGTVQATLRGADSVASTAAGTFGYAPFEQLLGRPVPASDLYGLGMTMLALASGLEPGDMPFEGNQVQAMALLAGNSLHPGLKTLLAGLTHPDADRRPATAREALTLLDRIPPDDILANALRGSDADFASGEVAHRPARVGVPATSPAPTRVNDPTGEAVWRARAARTKRLAGQPTRVLQATTLKLTPLRHCAFTPDGRHALMWWRSGLITATLLRVELATGRHEALVTEERALSEGFALSMDGRLALAPRDADVALITGLDRHPGGQRVVTATIPETAYSTTWLQAALSPDGSQAVRYGLGMLSVVSLPSGLVTATFPLSRGHHQDLRRGLRFAPDGASVLTARRRISANGDVGSLPGTAAGFDADGRLAAVARGRRLRAGPVTQAAPVRWGEGARSLGPASGAVEQLVFSPGGHLLAAVVAAGKPAGRALSGPAYVEVFAADGSGDGAAIYRAGDTFCPSRPFDAIHAVGFSADGARLHIHARGLPHPLATEAIDLVSVHDLAARRAVGTLVFAAGQAPLTAFSATGETGGPELLSGPPAESEAALDLVGRLHFWRARVTRGELPAATPLGPLVARSAGLTHLLPLAVLRAREAPVASGFGAGRAADRPGNLAPEAVEEALGWLAGRSETERDALFEQGLPAIVALAAERPRAPSSLARTIVLGLLGLALVAALIASCAG